jgi:UDP-4-amino-4,6-dideoxy-N-acetyl-beta-L-altrosamine transaminase
MIPYSKQSISESDIEAVCNVLRSEYLTQGAKVPEFEEAIANYCKVDYSVATNSATSALHIACLSLGVGVGDVVWTSPISFAASANCAALCGASVDFIDIDPNSFNISIDCLVEQLETAKVAKTLPKVIVVVHMAGLSSQMIAINDLSIQYGFRVIEDASHALGGSYNDTMIGSCRYSDITVFSFHPVKSLTAGEGGIATTNNLELASRMRLLRSHGITKLSEEFIHPSNDPWYYEQQTLGLNYRMTDISAALGLSQLLRLDQFIANRSDIAERYFKTLVDTGLQFQEISKNCKSAHHLFVCQANFKSIGKSRSQLFQYMRNQGVALNVHYIPIYQHPYYRKISTKAIFLENANNYYEQAFSIPIYPDLELDGQRHVINSLRNFFSD